MKRLRLIPKELWGDHPAQLRAFTKPADDGCWHFVGFVNPSTGYGQLGRNLLAHRVAWEVANDRPIPPGLVVDHTCHNARPDCHDDRDCTHRRCVNPAHLEAVTRRTNITRGNGATGTNAKKTHCPHGHAFDAANTYECRGRRQCRICRKRHADKWNAARSAEKKADLGIG